MLGGFQKFCHFPHKTGEKPSVESCLRKIGDQTFYILMPSYESNENDSEFPGKNQAEMLMLLKQIEKVERRRILNERNVAYNIKVPDGTDADSWDISSSIDGDNNRQRNERWCRPSYIPVFLLLFLIFLVVLIPALDRDENVQTSTTCRLEVVESIPVGLEYTAGSPIYSSTFATWQNLINRSQISINIASYYWTLKSSEVFPSSEQGEIIFQNLLSTKAKLRIVQNVPSDNNTDIKELIDKKLADVKVVNFTKLIGNGILHTKFWVVDNLHFYVGSANMDWRSLTQVKELGIVGYDCPILAEDLNKIFEVYWLIGDTDKIPDNFPDSLTTEINYDTPIFLNNKTISAFFSSSPPQISLDGRTDDIDAIVTTIKTAKKYICIAVMDYIPALIYSKHLEYWEIIENELRHAYLDRNIRVQIMVSEWKHSPSIMWKFIKSLLAIKSVTKGILEVKSFKVPTNETFEKIPFSRVNHNKYMITDQAVLIGTSNWSGDYFVNTGGVSVIFRNEHNNTAETIRSKIFNVFMRDWNSEFTQLL